MSRALHIVNGDLNLQILKDANIDGDFLMWGDFLYSGEIKRGVSLEEFSKIRAKYIASLGIDSFNRVYKEFKKRNSTLNSFRRYLKIYLWFEADIYDQLQLLQILDWFRKYALFSSNIYIIDIKKPLMVSSKDEILDYLIFQKIKVKEPHYNLAQRAWDAFGANTPYPWYQLMFDENIEILKHLKYTIKRVLEEYPNIQNGLSRTEYQILYSIKSGAKSLNSIYIKTQNMEERPFMGKAILAYYIKNLIKLELLKSKEEKGVELTPFGYEVLESKEFLYKYKKLDRWIGGVHLTNSNLWCWDSNSSLIVDMSS